jgi:niacin transporter
MKKHSVRHLTIAALLVAMGIIIPMAMPRITVGPASFTLASHVPLFLAMFFSPAVAIAVALGTGFGFFLSATPIIALRAMSHLLFAAVGAFYLQKHPTIVLTKNKFVLFNGKFQLFNVGIGLIHSAAELAVVSVFYTMGNLPETYYSQGYMYSIFLLMGFGGLIHSLVDYNIAYFVANALSKQFDLPVFTQARKIEQQTTPVFAAKKEKLI